MTTSLFAKLVNEVLVKSAAGEHELAMVSACILVDSTAKRAYPEIPGNAERYKHFLSANKIPIGLSLNIFFGGGMEFSPLPGVHLKTNERGRVTLEEILYALVRCFLLHEATLNGHVQFDADIQVANRGDQFVFSNKLPWGIASAAVLAPVNATESLPSNPQVLIGRRHFALNDLWGKSALIHIKHARNELG